MDERARRIGYNESLFREVNERVKELERDFGPSGESVQFVCECADESCMERIRMTPAEYEQVRSRPTTFAIVAGHEIADVERVVSANDCFAVVEKLPGEPARVAEQADPRS